MSRIADELGKLWKELATIKAAQARTFTEGTVAAVDAKRGLARIHVGERNGKPVLGPWVPYQQQAGAMKGHVPVSVGQQMTMIAPGGDWSRAGLIPMTFSKANPSPSDAADANAWTFGDVRVDLAGDTVKVTAPKVEVVAESATIDAKSIALGGAGGDPVARVGDLVAVRSGSSAGLWPIVSGSSVVSAVD